MQINRSDLGFLFQLGLDLLKNAPLHGIRRRFDVVPFRDHRAVFPVTVSEVAKPLCGNEWNLSAGEIKGWLLVLIPEDVPEVDFFVHADRDEDVEFLDPEDVTGRCGLVGADNHHLPSLNFVGPDGEVCHGSKNNLPVRRSIDAQYTRKIKLFNFAHLIGCDGELAIQFDGVVTRV